MLERLVEENPKHIPDANIAKPEARGVKQA
jgi:hypothetical protein